jgi:hypothetical protein
MPFLRFLRFVFVPFSFFFFLRRRQVHIDPQHVCTVLTILQNPSSFAFLTARQCPHQRRTLIHFLFNFTQFYYYVSFAIPFSLNNHEVDHIWPFAGWCRRGSIRKRYECVYSSLFYRFSFQSRRPDGCHQQHCHSYIDRSAF